MKSYNFASGVQCIIGGLEIGGYDDDGGVTIDKVEAYAVMTAGADGEATVSRNANRNATVVITVKQTSASNAILQSLLASQELDATGISYAVPFLLTDDSNGESVSSAHSVIEGPPTRTFLKEASAREWTILIDNVSEVAAGASALISEFFSV